MTASLIAIPTLAEARVLLTNTLRELLLYRTEAPAMAEGMLAPF